MKRIALSFRQGVPDPLKHQVNPAAMDGGGAVHIPVAWTPAILAGVTDHFELT
jgi:hypothetical protein